MWILTPDSDEYDMINLCDFCRVNVVPIPDCTLWELVAYQINDSDDEGVLIKVGDKEELTKLMNAMAGSLIHSSFAHTTPTLH